MNQETKTCQNCKNPFVMEPDDFGFYEKIQVPPPTFCPKCRLQRRLAWFKGFRLYKRKCDLCGEEKISMYKPDAPYTVYCADCWWSDKWNPEDYAREYDFSKPFFEQLDEFLHKVPIRGIAVTKSVTELSPYTNHCDHSKNCYLIFYSDYDEDCQYGFYLTRDKSLLDCSVYWECEQCYDGLNGFRNNRVHGSRGNVHTSFDCYFLRDAKSAEHCFGSANLHNKKYVFFNEQLTKEEYEKKLNEMDLGSYKTYQEMKSRAEEIWKNSIPNPCYDYMFNDNCTGNYVFYSKNCKECYDSGYCEDCKYMMLIKTPSVKDSYDYVDWGENAERIYEGITIGNNVSDVKFSQDIHNSHHVEYSKSCMNDAFLLGCSGLRNKEYCVFNKRYDKEAFHAIRKKILAHMEASPYRDAMGYEYKYGEFFPMSLSPHDYNDTFAQMFYPLDKEEALQRGLTWAEMSPNEYATTMNAADLPDHVRDAKDGVLNEVIKCTTCPRGYKITHQELQFLRQHNLPLPRRCPFCRIEEKVKRWSWQMTLIERDCDKCGKHFRTSYRKEDAPIAYCTKCYLEYIF